MLQMLSLGAINKFTGEYVYPKIANKKDEYTCPECNKELILCQGEINIHHFRHKIDKNNPCHRYNYPTESQIHKDAKLLIKKLLERKASITIIRNCRLYNTHKTSSENRPEPWFEIDAKTLITLANSSQNTIINIPCIRNELCDKCIETNVCKGLGHCLLQTNDLNTYIKNKDFKCSYNCKPNKCPIKYCDCMSPQWYFDCHSGMCANCAMGIEPLRYIYLDVPYSKKNEVKSLGAKFNFNGPYKKWFIKSDNKNKDIIMSKFKEWRCPY